MDEAMLLPVMIGHGQRQFRPAGLEDGQLGPQVAAEGLALEDGAAVVKKLAHDPTTPAPGLRARPAGHRPTG